jgi:hypothetical protein
MSSSAAFLTLIVRNTALLESGGIYGGCNCFIELLFLASIIVVVGGEEDGKGS